MEEVEVVERETSSISQSVMVVKRKNKINKGVDGKHGDVAQP